MFCPTCKALALPKNGKIWCSRCQKEYDVTSNKSDQCVIRGKEKEQMVVENSAPTLPKAKVECPKCKHNEAFWVLRQTRAADEPETKIYRCCECGASWREYG